MAIMKVLLGAALLYVAMAETCPGYYTSDVLGIKVWVPAFDCPTLLDDPSSKFCCGTKDNPHCCGDCAQSITSACITGGAVSNETFDGLLIGGVVLLVALLVSCCVCCCRGCCGPRQPAVTVVQGNPIVIPHVGTAGGPPPYTQMQ
ncbi:uncharacterized protein [Branchiostoma lanceolatum]|uniref:uncharacterized protein n=1 Tax=Branchiostoma lanceolatum TaxID=7740 RepID=UPI0034568E18